MAIKTGMESLNTALTRRVVQLETENEKLRQIKDYRNPSDNKSALTTVRDVEWLINHALRQQMGAITHWHRAQHSPLYRARTWVKTLLDWIRAKRKARQAVAQLEAAPEVAR